MYSTKQRRHTVTRLLLILIRHPRPGRSGWLCRAGYADAIKLAGWLVRIIGDFNRKFIGHFIPRRAHIFKVPKIYRVSRKAVTTCQTVLILLNLTSHSGGRGTRTRREFFRRWAFLRTFDVSQARFHEFFSRHRRRNSLFRWMKQRSHGCTQTGTISARVSLRQCECANRRRRRRRRCRAATRLSRLSMNKVNNYLIN